MAAAAAASSSSSSSSSSSLISGSNPPDQYDVFISFRGEDTRNNFTSHLYAALCRSKIETFIDDREVEKGDEISSTLSNAIRSSSLSIIIFSQDYASSSWCLNELLEILECNETRGQIIVPVFYHVSPSNIRKQTGTYKKAFAEHEKRFKKMKDKIQKWRAALAQVANLSGWDLNKHDRSEYEFVDGIVKDVFDKLNKKSSSDHLDPGLVGIISRIERVESLLCIGRTDIRIIGIWGMGGIGKTTIARAIFNRIANKFDAVCFLANVRDVAKNGLNHLQEKILFEISRERSLNINAFMLSRLRRMKILIVLDDVDDSEHLKFLVGDRSLFGLGSRIIITSRDRQVLNNGVDELYELEGLNFYEALQLFSTNAFKQNHPPKDYKELSRKIINYAQGNPLALKVLGCFLLGKSKLEWKSSLDKLKKCPNLKIQNVLRISYDGLDDQEKEIFLFIACFFKGEKRDRTEDILDGCGLFTKIGISRLVDKCIVTITENRLVMHDLIVEMGHGIVRQESKEIGERSRLWDPQDIYNLFKRNIGTGAVESISLELSQISELYISPDAFKRMPNLKLLKFCISHPYNWRKEVNTVHICEGIEFFSEELRYLCWYGYPLKSLPFKFNPEHLVELDMPNSNIEYLWKDSKPPGNLRRIVLRDSTQLNEVPDLSGATNLQIMDFNGCSSLTKFPTISWNLRELNLCKTAIEEVPDSAIESLNKLVSLDISNNRKLKNLPTSMRHFMTSLRSLSLNGCSNITEFPETPREITKLFLSGTAIEEVPSFVERLTNLKYLQLDYCKRLNRVSSGVFQLEYLETLSLRGCPKLEHLPEVPKINRNLSVFLLGGTAIKKLPSSIGLLHGLSVFDVKNCKNIESFPDSMCDLSLLHGLDLSGIFEVDKMLESLIFSSPTCFGYLRNLYLEFCNLHRILCPSRLWYLYTSIESLFLRGNNFESLDLELFPLLITLDISYCQRLQSLNYRSSKHLRYLWAGHCISMETLQTSNNLDLGSPYSSTDHRFVFLNCLKLDENARINIQANAQLRVQHMANKGSIVNSTCFEFPGSEIPEWISFQNEGYSVTMDLPPHWYSDKFFGFVLCIVASCESSNQGSLSLHCKCNFIDSDCDMQESIADHTWWLELVNSDHVYLKSWNDDKVRDHSFSRYSFYQKARFEFSLTNDRFSKFKYSSNVKKCGVHLLYSESEDEITENRNDIANEAPHSEVEKVNEHRNCEKVLRKAEQIDKRRLHSKAFDKTIQQKKRQKRH